MFIKRAEGTKETEKQRRIKENQEEEPRKNPKEPERTRGVREKQAEPRRPEEPRRTKHNHEVPIRAKNNKEQ